MWKSQKYFCERSLTGLFSHIKVSDQGNNHAWIDKYKKQEWESCQTVALTACSRGREEHPPSLQSSKVPCEYLAHVTASGYNFICSQYTMLTLCTHLLFLRTPIPSLMWFRMAALCRANSLCKGNVIASVVGWTLGYTPMPFGSALPVGWLQFFNQGFWIWPGHLFWSTECAHDTCHRQAEA